MGTSTKLKTARYRVRRWTAFEWNEGDDADARKQREDHLESFATMIERRMVGMTPRFTPRCSRVRVDHAPQLLFELTVEATDENDARKRATYRFDRALQAKVRQAKVRGRAGQPVRLAPPWGRWEVEEVTSLRAVG